MRLERMQPFVERPCMMRLKTAVKETNGSPVALQTVILFPCNIFVVFQQRKESDIFKFARHVKICYLSAASWKFSSNSIYISRSKCCHLFSNRSYCWEMFVLVQTEDEKPDQERMSYRKSHRFLRSLSFQKIEVIYFPKKQITQKTVLWLVFYLILLHVATKNKFRCPPRSQ